MEDNNYKASKCIPKGTVIQEWKPYKIISIIEDKREEGFAELPGYAQCPVLNHSIEIRRTSQNLGSPELPRFVNRLFRDGSFEALCVLALFDELLCGKRIPMSGALERESHDGNRHMEDSSLLIESWPFVQNEVSWMQFLSLYHYIESSMHMLTIDHPLTHYAKHVLFQTEHFDEAVKICQRKKWIPKESENRLQVSQFLLDYVASLPPRIVGVLIGNPASNSTSVTLKQCSIPSAYLELTVDKLSDQMKCKMISMYDLQREEPITVSTRVNGLDPLQDQLDGKLQINSMEKALMAQRLAHNHFQNEKYREAMSMYKECYEFFSPKDETRAADLLHSMAAVRLSQLKFLQAQREWKKGSKYQHVNAGIALQLAKQTAYGYFENSRAGSKQIKVLQHEAIGSSRTLFITPRTVSPNMCRKLIAWAKDHASEQGGWTTSRHYAVPTNDIPLHVSKNLLNWFVGWFQETAIPLLQSQFRTKQTFFVHDAFLVRYSAGSSSEYLPLHYDESTHSLVLALNSEFDGGGTYFYNLDHTVVPGSGSLVSFRGNKLLHGGNVVTKGERFIIAAFLYVDDETTCEQKRSSSTSVQNTSKRSKPEEGFSFGFF
ncbi:unnamed protein product [Cylindrotheca closterium]|uniref:Fe2OG dioxygenase domain-containing protein n=1 Tax=Cylindrotheca closterium TaxID=2856 RepID=A0AAD2PVT8_9STRA|nr:unnamed protein product [Cylindrotheca closterium]